MKIRLIRHNTLNKYVFLVLNLILTIAVFSIVHFTLKGNRSYDIFKNTTIFLSFIMCVQFFSLFQYSKNHYHYYMIFVLMFFVFHFGTFLIFSFDLDYNYFYVLQYSIEYISITLEISYLCFSALILAGVFINDIKPFKFNYMNSISDNEIYITSKFFMTLTGIVSFIILSFKTLYFIQGRYPAVRIFESQLPSFFGLIEYFYFPFALLTILYSNNKKSNFFALVFASIWLLLTALYGDRTTGIGGLLVLFLILYKNKTNKKHKLFKFSLLAFGLISIVIFTVYIRSFRVGLTNSDFGLVKVFTEIFGEMGSSFLPLTLIVRICPDVYPYLNGTSYLYSLIASVIPESLDFTGTITLWSSNAIRPLYWISSSYEYTFGTGYSLSAEAYANFGYFAIVPMIIIGVILIKLMAYDSFNRFSKYTSSVMLFHFFTLPRRNFYYIVNHPYYSILIVSLILYLIIQFKKSRG